MSCTSLEWFTTTKTKISQYPYWFLNLMNMLIFKL